MAELQWGTVPDWAMAAVTLCGFGLTLLALRREFKQRRQDAAMKVGASSRQDRRRVRSDDLH